jgi:hypothetical protein
MSDCLRCPVCSCAIFVLPFARETAGAARIRHSLLPLLRDNETQTSGASRRENADVYALFDIRIDFRLVIASSFGADRGADAGGPNKHRGHRPA